MFALCPHLPDVAINMVYGAEACWSGIQGNYCGDSQARKRPTLDDWPWFARQPGARTGDPHPLTPFHLQFLNDFTTFRAYSSWCV